MYQLPLRYIKVSNELAICATRIVAIMSTDSFQCRELIRKERLNKTLINGCGKRAAKTAIILDNGSVISCPKTIYMLMKEIENSNSKRINSKSINSIKRMRVYDIVDEEPNEEIDEDMMEASSDLSEDDLE